MGKITFKKPNLDNLLGVPWWIPAAVAAALYIAIQWGIPAIPAANPAFRILDSVFRPLGMLITAVCGVIAGFLYYKQRIKPSMTVRLLEPHFSIPTPTVTPKGPKPETVDQSSSDSAIDSDLSLTVTKTPLWSLELLRQIEWKGFEELVAACFREESFRTETTQIGADEGVDIRLYEKGNREVYAVVHCKSCNDRPVGVKPVRELLGAITHDSVPRGIFVTTGDYAQEAIDFAKAHPIILITGEMLINEMLSYTDDARTRLMNILTDAGFDVTHVAPEEASISVNEAADGGSNSLDFPIPESNVTDTDANAVADVAGQEAPTDRNTVSEDRLANETTTLDFPMLEFPDSEPKTKTAEFFGVVK